MNIKIIGAGLGGLSASCLLARKGHDVTVLEKNSTPGGKINELRSRGFRFDLGPSVLTMPFILERLFQKCGANIEDYINIKPVDPICRYFYPDGSEFDCFRDHSLNVAQIQDFAPNDVDAYKEFLSYSEDLYNRTKEAFLFNPLYSFSDLWSLNLLDFLKIDAFKTVAERVDTMFESTQLRKLYKRFTTYNGSSPYQAPATLNIIPHVEMEMGGYYISGGMYELAKGLEKLAKELGTSFSYDTDVQQIRTDNSGVNGLIDTTGNKYPADIVVSNADAFETHHHLLNDELSVFKKRTLDQQEPSSSGFLMLLGIDKKYNALTHHNIFFSEDYRKEFSDIFEEKVMPQDPTIYIANTSHTEAKDAVEGGSNLFVLVNAPYINDNQNWNEQTTVDYRKKLIQTLQKRGLTDLGSHISYSKCINPRDFYQMYRSRAGSIYGTSSNEKYSAFLRPANKSRSVDGLYMVGGSTHPGGGIPLVTLSAHHAVELIERHEGN